MSRGETGASSQALVEDDASPIAVGAGGRDRLDQAFGDPLSRHLHETQLLDVENLGSGLVASQRPAQLGADRFAVALRLHVDEVDDDNAANIAEPKLVRYLFGGLEVVLEHGLFKVRLSDVLPGVHVDHRECLGALDDQ